jgi:hypothetical protein
MATVTYPSPRAAWGKDARGFSSHVQFEYTGPASYVTGGETITPGQVKLGKFEYVAPAVAIATTDAATAVLFVYNLVTGKMQAFWQTGAAAAAALPEVDNATNLSDYTAEIVAEGRG